MILNNNINERDVFYSRLYYNSCLTLIIRIKKPLVKTRGLSCDRDRIRTCDRLLRRQMLYPTELRDQSFLLSGWQDSNLRPPAPKAGAITGLRYTPKWLSKYLRRDRDSNPGDSYPSTD